MSDTLTHEERDAIASYAETDVQKIPTGKSGIYDEFGVPLDLPNKKTRGRLSTMRELSKLGMNRNQIANELKMSRPAFDQLVNRWGGMGEE